MSYRKSVASVLAGLLSGFCFSPYAVSAQEPELYFYPKNKWVVQYQDSAGQGMSACTVRNELNNGYILKITGTRQGMEAIDIDFRQDVFEKGLNYEVQYSIPGGARAVISSRASASSVIQSDLSGRSDFSQNLTAAGVLDVQIQDNVFRAYLTGLKAALPQFNDCVASQGADDAPRFTEEMAQKMKQDSEKYKPSDTPVLVQADDDVIEIVDSPDTPMPEEEKKPNVTIESVQSPKPIYTVTKRKPVVADLTGKGSAGGHDFVAMRDKISRLERDLIAMEKKNGLLEDDLKAALSDSKQEKISVSSDNWNLERATMRFNEAERQIMRLGRQLKSQRAVCEQEKSELENMLFDPKLTEQNQLARLSSLEAELERTKTELYRQKRQYEERVKLLEQQLSAM